MKITVSRENVIKCGLVCYEKNISEVNSVYLCDSVLT